MLPGDALTAYVGGSEQVQPKAHSHPLSHLPCQTHCTNPLWMKSEVTGPLGNIWAIGASRPAGPGIYAKKQIQLDPSSRSA